MSEIFGLIVLENIRLLPWWMQLAGGLMVLLAVFHIVRNFFKRQWLQMARGMIGTVVILIFMSVWGQVYLGMTLNQHLM